MVFGLASIMTGFGGAFFAIFAKAEIQPFAHDQIDEEKRTLKSESSSSSL